MDVMTTHIQKLTTQQFSAKYEKITTLVKTITQLELEIDGQEQYAIRPNLRIQGLQDDARGEDVDKKVLTMINEGMGFYPPLTCTDLERSRRLGRAAPGQARPRAVIARFATERIRDAVYRCRGALKGFNDAQHPDFRIFDNEHLTARRAALCLGM